MIIARAAHGLFAAVVAAGLIVGVPFAAPAATLGYGEFLGEFSGNVNGKETELAGHSVKSEGNIDFTNTEFKEGEPIGGTWESQGGAGNGLILAVKYGNQYSLFRYDNVGTGDTGLFASDPALTGFAMSTNGQGKPYAISHIEAYSVVPLPPALILLATALAVLFGFTRVRQT